MGKGTEWQTDCRFQNTAAQGGKGRERRLKNPKQGDKLNWPITRNRISHDFLKVNTIHKPQIGIVLCVTSAVKAGTEMPHRHCIAHLGIQLPEQQLYMTALDSPSLLAKKGL